MNIVDQLLSNMWLYIGNFIFLCGCACAACAAPWKLLVRQTGLQHAYFGAIVLVALFWCMRAGVSPGLSIHFLGMTSLTLVFGADLAILAGALVLFAMTLLGFETPLSWGINGVCLVLIPVAFTSVWWRFVETKFGKNFFVYLFGCGFIGSAFSLGLAAMSMSGVLWADDVYSLAKLNHEYFQYLPLILFPEALLNGIFLTSVLVYHPDWVRTFDAVSYIDKQ